MTSLNPGSSSCGASANKEAFGLSWRFVIQFLRRWSLGNIWVTVILMTLGSVLKDQQTNTRTLSLSLSLFPAIYFSLPQWLSLGEESFVPHSVSSEGICEGLATIRIGCGSNPWSQSQMGMPNTQRAGSSPIEVAVEHIRIPRP